MFWQKYTKHFNIFIDVIKNIGVAKNFEEYSLKTTLSNEKIYRGQSAISEPREARSRSFFLRILERARPFQSIPPLFSFLYCPPKQEEIRYGNSCDTVHCFWLLMREWIEFSCLHMNLIRCNIREGWLKKINKKINFRNLKKKRNKSFLFNILQLFLN